MADVHISGITKSFGQTEVLKGIDLNIDDGEFVSLVGPSGCGKSTLLRIIAGLETQSGGEISIAGDSVSGVRAADRNLSMVFQSYALYPHLTVSENIAVPLRMRQLNGHQRLPVIGRFLPGAKKELTEINSAIQSAAQTLEIDKLLARKPGELSGGQRQRVALGRALVRKPAAFLLDEPLSNLDAKLRVQTRSEIAQLHRRLGATFIYVTHDQVEAMTMSSRIAVMMDGEILQCSAPEVVYEDPEDIRVAEFIGSPKINILQAEFSGGRLRFANNDMPLDVLLPDGERVQIGLRPEALFATDTNPAFRGNVRHVENLGSEIFAQVDVEGSETSFTVRCETSEKGRLVIGSEIGLGFDPSSALVFDVQGKRRRGLETPSAIQSEVA